MFNTQYVDNFHEFFEKMQHHFEEHYAHCEEVRAEDKPLNIDADLFQEGIDQGIFNIFCLLNGELLVGYVNVTVQKNPLYAKPQAIVDYLYIFPEERNKGYTKKAIKEIEKELVSEGIDELNIMLPDKDYSEDVASALGYSKTSSTYYKKLGE